MIRAISHIALRVEDVAEAESYYCRLFGLEVAFRDLTVEGVQRSLRPGTTWADAAERGFRPGLSSLWREGFNLALEQAPADGTGNVDHLGLLVEQEDVAETAVRARALGCTVLVERADIVVFNDRYGLRWELTSTQYDSPADQSTGARLGAWLDLG